MPLIFLGVVGIYFLWSLRKAAEKAVLAYTDNSFSMLLSVKALFNLWGWRGNHMQTSAGEACVGKMAPTLGPVLPEHKLNILVWLFLAIWHQWCLWLWKIGSCRAHLCLLWDVLLFFLQLEVWICEFLAFSRWGGGRNIFMYFCTTWALLLPLAWRV